MKDASCRLFIYTYIENAESEGGVPSQYYSMCLCGSITIEIIIALFVNLGYYYTMLHYACDFHVPYIRNGIYYMKYCS